MKDVQTLTVTTADQHRFNATLYPTAEPDAPVLLFMSALGTPAKVYRHLGKEMVQHGIQVCTPDWRGIDSSSIRAGRSHDSAVNCAWMRQSSLTVAMWNADRRVSSGLAKVFA